VLHRTGHVRNVQSLLRQFPVVAILGPRQSGKTTLGRQIAAGRKVAHIFDLESADDVARLADPMLALRPLGGLVVLDEIQHRPELFPALRVLVDEPRTSRRFLVLGSASPELLRQTSESLAGRIAYHELDGFGLDEVGAGVWARLWRRGGLPRSFLARSESQSVSWRREFVRTYIERDLPAFGVRIPAPTLRRFWMMLTHYHGQVWNAAEFASAFGVAHTTVQRYLDTLTETFMIRQLPSWHENLGKRQVKAPKIYVRDSGLLHTLLGIATAASLDTHPKIGASWEGFALNAVIARIGARPEECSFWATHQGAELDLLVIRDGRRLGFEFRRTSAPQITKSMRIALQDLRLEELVVVHAGPHSFPMADRMRAVALEGLLQEIGPDGRRI
jgi:predicted AAA+ superfamily ATPase